MIEYIVVHLIIIYALKFILFWQSDLFSANWQFQLNKKNKTINQTFVYEKEIESFSFVRRKRREREKKIVKFFV